MEFYQILQTYWYPQDTGYNEHVHEEVPCQKKCFWQNDGLTNLAILYGPLYSL